MKHTCRVCHRNWYWIVEDKYYYCNDCYDKNNCICKNPYKEEWCAKHWLFSEQELKADLKRSLDYSKTNDIEDILKLLLSHKIGINECVNEIKSLYE